MTFDESAAAVPLLSTATILMVGFDPAGSPLDLSYRQIATETLGAGNAYADLKSLSAALAAGSYAWPAKRPRYAPPSPSCPTPASRLSLQGKSNTYVVIKIDPILKAQFSTTRSPFALGGTNPDAAAYMMQPEACDANGNPTPIAASGSTVAHFISLGADAGAKYPNGFAFSFDINIEVSGKQLTSNGTSIPVCLPIIVDPDIRDPGGIMP